MEALIAFARSHNLAIWADEVYERITFDTDMFLRFHWLLKEPLGSIPSQSNMEWQEIAVVI